jgi:hypothetical protein
MTLQVKLSALQYCADLRGLFTRDFRVHHSCLRIPIISEFYCFRCFLYLMASSVVDPDPDPDPGGQK